MVRPALAFSQVVLVASAAAGVAAFLRAGFLAVLTWLEILSAIAGGLAIAALIQWCLQDRPPDCARRVTLALVFSFVALMTAIATDIGLR
jgi:hypothetical protein